MPGPGGEKVLGSHSNDGPGPERGKGPHVGRTQQGQPWPVIPPTETESQREGRPSRATQLRQHWLRVTGRSQSPGGPGRGRSSSHSFGWGVPSYPERGAVCHSSWGGCPGAQMACLPARYKLVELLCYVIMGFFPALVILSMVSAPARPGAPSWLEGPGLTLGMVESDPLLWHTVKLKPQDAVEQAG